MSELTHAVTPLTRGLIWLSSGKPESKSEIYKSLDYLLDGLLTASLSEASASSQVLVGKSFGKSFFVLMSAGPIEKATLSSYATLLDKELKAEERLLVVDEVQGFGKLLELIPSKLKSHTQLFE